jgi:hypothetical protein
VIDDAANRQCTVTAVLVLVGVPVGVLVIVIVLSFDLGVCFSLVLVQMHSMEMVPSIVLSIFILWYNVMSSLSVLMYSTMIHECSDC